MRALRSLTAVAVELLSAAQRQDAVAVLRAALVDITPRPDPACDLLRFGVAEAGPAAGDLNDVVDAATLYAATLRPHEGGDWHSLRWARFAHRASLIMVGAEQHHRTHRAAEVLARVLASYHLDGEAIAVRQDLCRQLTETDGPAAAAAIAARVELALLRHAAGYCAAATGELGAAWTAWSRCHGVGHPDSVAIRTQLAALLGACGERTAAARHTVQAYRDYHSSPTRTGSEEPARLPVRWLGEPPDDHASLCRRGRLDLHRTGPGGGSGHHADHPKRRSAEWREFLND